MQASGDGRPLLEQLVVTSKVDNDRLTEVHVLQVENPPSLRDLTAVASVGPVSNNGLAGRPHVLQAAALAVATS
eukprot:2454930-Lingulodinium_polyedra.AAC.1